MALNGKSKVKDLIANPEICAIIEEYLPGMSTDPRAKQGYGMPLKTVCSFPQTGLSKEKAAEMIARIEALGLE